IYDYSRVKSERTLQPGILELLSTARDLAIPLGLKSNTLSGRGNRSLLERQRILDLIAAHAHPAELGRRKPDPSGVDNSLTASVSPVRLPPRLDRGPAPARLRRLRFISARLAADCDLDERTIMIRSAQPRPDDSIRTPSSDSFESAELRHSGDGLSSSQKLMI